MFRPKKEDFEMDTSNLVFLAWNCPPVISEDQEESLNHVRQPSLLEYRIRV